MKYSSLGVIEMDLKLCTHWQLSRKWLNCMWWDREQRKKCACCSFVC